MVVVWVLEMHCSLELGSGKDRSDGGFGDDFVIFRLLIG